MVSFRAEYKELIRSVNMAGTKAGGKAAAATNKAKYGADFYAKIGASGGKKGTTGGFYANRELARAAGAKGGRISRRTSKKSA
jgi:general stress protein YciG